jgi:hypothetical protein
MLFLALAYSLYRFADKGVSKRKQKKQQKLAAAVASEPAPVQAVGPLPAARPEQARGAQLWARTRLEMTQVFKSPAFIVLMVMGLFNALPALWSGGELFGTPTLPVTSSLIPILEGSFSFVPLLVAIYYAGELVWRERDRKMHEIVDATPLPNWAYVVPKTAAVALVLLSILAGQRHRRDAGSARQGSHESGDRQISGLVRACPTAVFPAARGARRVRSGGQPTKYVGWG